MLRSRLPHRVNLTDKGRQKLLTVGKPLGAAIKELISIVAYRAFLRWKAADGVACDQWLGGLLKHYRTAG